MRWTRWCSILLASFSLSLAACGDDNDDQNGDAGTRNDASMENDASAGDASSNSDGGLDDGGPGPGDGGNTFATFVKDLIENHTNETEAPVEVESLDLPEDLDSNAFNELF